MDDEEEMALLRDQRKAKLGHVAGTTRGELRNQAKAGWDEGDDDDDEDGPVVVDTEASGVPDHEVGDDPLRYEFPMSFGKQETKHAPNVSIHDTTIHPSTATAAPPSMTRSIPPTTLSTEAHTEPTIGPPRPKPPTTASIGPPRPSNFAQKRTASAASGAAAPLPHDTVKQATPEGEEPGGWDTAPRLPITNEVVLKGHSKVVSAIDVDHTGSRVITGGMDYNVRMYDFNGMKSDMKPFRELQPHEGHPINALSFSPSGDAFLAVSGSSQAKVYDRDGMPRGEFKRGDMYMRDLRNTKGHVAGCCDGKWHPTERHTAMTSSNDGTVRIWDTNLLEQKMVIKPTTVKPGRVPVTACCYKHDGTMIAAALTDGTIQLWSVSGNFGRSAAVGVVACPKQQMLGKQTWKYSSGASQRIQNAHPHQTEVSDLLIMKNGTSMLSRGDDETLKLWDLRKFKTPVHVWNDLPFAHSQTKLCVSPMQDLVLTGVAGAEKGAGAIAVMDLKTFKLVQIVGMPTIVTALQWSPKINQILVGTGDRTSGGTHVLYSPMMSEKGALLCAGKKPRQKNPYDFEPTPIIHTPGSLPLYRDEAVSRKRGREKDLNDPKKARIPDAGPTITGPGGGGKIGSTSKTLLTAYLLEKGGMKQLKDQMDPREAILRHGGAEDEMSEWMKAYAVNQPKRIFAEEEAEEEK